MNILNKNYKFKDDLEAFLSAKDKNKAIETLYNALENRFKEMQSDMQGQTDYGSINNNYMSSQAREYYEELARNLRAKQLTKPSDVPMPESEVDKVLDNMQLESKVLNGINVVSNTFITKVITNGKAVQKGTWGDLPEAVVKEMLGAFKVVELEETKVSCFGQVSTDMLDAGVEYLATAMNNTLVEGLVTAIEEAIVSGTGKKMPIGLDRDLAGTVTDGVYPQKTAIAVTDFKPVTYAGLVKRISKDSNGRSKKIDKVQLIVNSDTYLTKILPATTIINPLVNMGYSTNVFPFPTDVMVSEAVADNEAIMCLLGEYIGVIGKQIQVVYSDDFKFLDDIRCFKAKAFMTGRPVDNTAAIRLDISGLEALVPNVTVDGIVKTKEQQA